MDEMGETYFKATVLFGHVFIITVTALIFHESCSSLPLISHSQTNTMKFLLDHFWSHWFLCMDIICRKCSGSGFSLCCIIHQQVKAVLSTSL